MPGQFVVIVCGCREDGIAQPGAAKLIWTTRGAMDGDKKERTLRHPPGRFMRQTSALWMVHAQDACSGSDCPTSLEIYAQASLRQMAAGGARRSARVRWIKNMVGRVAPRAPWGDESNARCPMYAGANLLRERNGCCRFSARAERRALPCPVLRRTVSRKRDTGSMKRQ